MMKSLMMNMHIVKYIIIIIVTINIIKYIKKERKKNNLYLINNLLFSIHILLLVQLNLNINDHQSTKHYYSVAIQLI